MAIPPNSLFVRVRHLKNSEGSIYLNDLDTQDNHNQHLKIPVYVPYGGTVDIPLNDAVLIAYKRGSLFRHAQNNLLEAFVFSSQCVLEINSTTELRADADVVLVDTSAGNVTVRLPDLNVVEDTGSVVIKKVTTDTNEIIIESLFGDPIENLPTPITEGLAAITFHPTETGWWASARYPSVASSGGSSSIVYDEDYFTVVDGTVTDYTLSSSPVTDSELVYFNGMLLSEGASRDYTISGTTLSIDPSVPRLSGDTLYVRYVQAASTAYKAEVFDVTDPTTKTYTLTFEPLPNSERVFWNGVGLARGAGRDYTVTSNSVEIDTNLPLHADDRLTIQYSYD